MLELLLIPINQFPSPAQEQRGLFHHQTNIGFSGESGALLCFSFASVRKASGSDLKLTVTCLATEPLGLLMSAERM